MKTSRFPRWIVLLAFLPGLLNQIPVLGAFLQQDETQERFLGVRHQPTDFSQYMAIARHHSESGERTAPNPFVTESQDGRWVMSYLWLVGQVHRGTGMNLVLSWHLVGLLASWLFFLVLWQVLGAFFYDQTWRAIAFLMICFSGGLEWIPFGLNQLGVSDFDLSAQAIRYRWNWTTLAAGQNPMWLAGHTLMLGALFAWLSWFTELRERTRPRHALGVTLLIVSAFFVHPYTGVAAGLLLGALSLCRRFSFFDRNSGARDGIRLSSRAWLLGVGACALAALTLSLYLWWARQDPVYARTAENATRWRKHYSPVWFPLLTGLPFLLACTGLRAKGQLKEGRGLVLIFWLSALLLLSYVPLLPGVKFLFLLHVPICILATLTLAHWVERGGRCAVMMRSRSFQAILVTLFALGSVSGIIRDVSQGHLEPGIHAPKDQLVLLSHLDELEPGNVLTSNMGGNLVPWKTGNSVYIGHWFLSYDYPERMQNLEMFWAKETPTDQRLKFLRAQNIRYVLEDPFTGIQSTDRALPIEWVYSNPYGRIGRVGAQ